MFITLEGIEGSGKSVQLARLEAEFLRRGVAVICTREPGGTQFGTELRQVLLRKDGAAREPMAELLLYLADRWQHLKEVIEPGLVSGRHVLCDRYHDATLAYQGYARGIDPGAIRRLAEDLNFPSPDLTLLLDLDVEAALHRARSRNVDAEAQTWSRFELEDLDFHRRVRRGYHLLAQAEPRRIVIVDAGGAPDDVFGRLRGLLESRGILPAGV